MTAVRHATSETGLMGHPDKVADLIGDAVVDACLREDPDSRVGCQVMTTNGLIVIGGQITTNASIDLETIARDVIRDVGYENGSEGMAADSEILVRVTPQSREIGTSVDRGGAGDSAIVIGYACEETRERMPVSARVVHAIAERIDRARRDGEVSWLRPDGKIQATAEYSSEGVIISDVVLSVQHSGTVAPEQRESFLWSLAKECIPTSAFSPRTQLISRKDVTFTIGGPKADCGLSGRKVVADTYGGAARHGGGGLSGKDPTKIDRCGMYAARYVAKNLVAAGVAKQCEVELAFVIGHAEPVAVSVCTERECQFDGEELSALVRRAFALTPAAIIAELRLNRPIYQAAGLYGHFGREDERFTWERCDRIGEIQRVA